MPAHPAPNILAAVDSFLNSFAAEPVNASPTLLTASFGDGGVMMVFVEVLCLVVYPERRARYIKCRMYKEIWN